MCSTARWLQRYNKIHKKLFGSFLCSLCSSPAKIHLSCKHDKCYDCHDQMWIMETLRYWENGLNDNFFQSTTLKYTCQLVLYGDFKTHCAVEEAVKVLEERWDNYNNLCWMETFESSSSQVTCVFLYRLGKHQSEAWQILLYLLRKDNKSFSILFYETKIQIHE